VFVRVARLRPIHEIRAIVHAPQLQEQLNGHNHAATEPIFWRQLLENHQVLVLNFVSDLLAVFGNEESCVLGQLHIDFRVVEQCVVHVEVVEERVLVL